MKILITPLFLIAAFSCSRHPDTGQLKNEIIKTDRAMSDLVVKEGFLNSILIYADENIVKLNEGVYPVIGKKQFLETLQINPDQKH